MKKISKLIQTVNDSCEKASKHSEKLSKELTEMKEKSDSRIETYEHLDTVVDDINKEFAKKTSIFNKKDQTFLWTAVALQTLRWFIQPGLEIENYTIDKTSREESKAGGDREDKERKIFMKKKEEEGFSYIDDDYLSWPEYFNRPVPYDAMKGTDDLHLIVKKDGKNLSAKTHHSGTLGHDPVLGYFFGTMNIMTSSITFNKILWPTRRVYLISSKGQEVREDIGFVKAFYEMIEATKNDPYRFPAAVTRQAMHIRSDINTKCGLQIPMLPADMQQKLLTKGWNSQELKKLGNFINEQLSKNKDRIALQSILSFLINMIIKTVHVLMFDEVKDVDIDLYIVRTEKIISLSNVIAESLNISYVAGNVAIGIATKDTDMIKHGLCKMDIGGYIEAVHQIASSSVLQEKIRREFLEQKLYEKLVGDDYSFLK